MTLPAEAAGAAPGRGRLTALGGLDGVVLNVGIGLGRGMAGTSAAQWDQTFAVNTRAHFLVAAAALEALEPGAAIVFISSAASLRAATGIPAYDASKAALLGICRQVAREGMARGIRANLVIPSLVDTPLGREASRLNPGRTAPLAVRPSGHGLGGGVRHGVAAVRRIQLRQRAPAGPRRRRDRLRMTVVPAVDSAGFFVALDRGLFKAQGLTVNFVPVSSSETAIADQVAGAYDITGGNYVSYIQAQREHRANLDIFAEGSVMEPGTQGIYTLPDSPVATLADLKGQTVAINAPDNLHHYFRFRDGKIAYYRGTEDTAQTQAVLQA